MKSSFSDEQIDALKTAAFGAMENAHAPYSDFNVGAALLLTSGEIILGCNVENASFGATICAERTAIAAAVAQGHSNFAAICVVGDTEQPITPCGICRQTLMEFEPSMEVICCNAQGEHRVFKASDLLPEAFSL